MTLADPFPVFGRARDNTGYLTGAVISAVDITVGSSTISADTGTDGEYFLDIMNIANDTDTIQISATYEDKDATTTFVLDISGAAQNINLFLVAAGAFIVKLGWVVTE